MDASPDLPDRSPQALVALQIQPATLTLERGQPGLFEATARDASGQSAQVAPTWTLEAPIAALGLAGEVYPRQVGQTAILAQLGPLRAQATLIVTEPQVQQLTLAPAQAALAPGQRLQLSVRATSQAGQPLQAQPLIWRSDQEDVARVSSEGLVTAIEAGRAVITAQLGERTATALLDVTLVMPAQLVMQERALTLVPGQERALRAALLDAAGQPLAQLAPRWLSLDPTIVQAVLKASFGALTATLPVQVSAGVEQLVVGAQHACGLLRGLLLCWGDNTHGQTGAPLMMASSPPTLVSGLPPVVAAAAGARHTCALDAQGQAWCWGDGERGQLGQGAWEPSPRPVKVALNVPLTALSATDSHTCALDAQGLAWCWGAGQEGQLGHGQRRDEPLPVLVQGLRDVEQIAAGGRHTCAVERGGVGRCWGANDRGQLGDNALLGSSVPTRVSGGFTLALIYAGQDHSCALSATATPMCWGANERGQLAEATRQPRRTPIFMSAPPLARITQLALGAHHTCALAPGVDVYCAGAGDAGQLGTAGVVDLSVPASLAGPERFGSLAAGGDLSCAIDLDGLVWCWGGGQLTPTPLKGWP